MKFLFSTSNLGDHNINRIIINTVRAHAESNGKLELCCKDDMLGSRTLLKSISLSIIYLALKGLWISVFKPNKMALVSFDSIFIGRYAMATSYRSYDAYTNRASFIVGYIRALVKCGLYLKAVKRIIPLIDVAYIDDDENNKIDGFLIDQDENGKWELYFSDKDSDGKAEKVFIDIDEDGSPDEIGTDTNNDGKFDKWEKA